MNKRTFKTYKKFYDQFKTGFTINEVTQEIKVYNTLNNDSVYLPFYFKGFKVIYI